MPKPFHWSALLFALPLLCGCPAEKQKTDAVSGKTSGAKAAASIPDALFLAKSPEGAQPLVKVKQSSKVGDEVVFEAVVGGRATPFVSERAIVTVIDPAPKPCPVDEGCKTPWDYCCHTPDELLKQSGTVRFVGADGKPLAHGLEGHKGLAGLKKVVVQGKVSQTNEDGVFVVDATGVWIAP